MSFSSDMRNATKSIIDAHDKITRAATLDFFTGTVKDTPVDTGRARGNWVTSVDTPAQGEIDREDKTGSTVTAEIVAKTPEKAGQEVFMSNSLPYIDALEYGSSTKAPNGMMRRNLARVQRIVDKAIAKFRV